MGVARAYRFRREEPAGGRLSETGVVAVFHRPQAGSYRRLLDGARKSGEVTPATYMYKGMTLLMTK